MSKSIKKQVDDRKVWFLWRMLMISWNKVFKKTGV